MITNEEQYRIWKKSKIFERLGMKESCLIVFNGWRILIFEELPDQHPGGEYLTNDFLEK